jgi:predicted MFS family arabinose efflux permease
MDGTQGLRAWRWVFIIEGVITVAIAFGAFWILPNFPRTTSWLTEEERQLAVYRLQEDVGEDDWVSAESQTFFHGLKLALLDIKTWVLTILLLAIVSSASVTNFFPTVVKTLGYPNIETLLLTAPPYVLAVITTYLNAWHADRTGERFFHIVLPLCVGVAAFILAAATTATAPRYVAMMLMVPGVYTGYVVALAWISNSLPRPPAKRAAALAFINAISNTSSIYASYMYPQPKSGQPDLTVPLSVDCATAALAIIMTVIMRIILGRLNKKLARGEHVEGAINAVPGVGADRGFRFLV